MVTTASTTVSTTATTTASGSGLTTGRLTHLQRLEAEAIHIMREAVAESERPAMLYSIGKDSSVMLHLAKKAFFPSKPPFPLVHVDTSSYGPQGLDALVRVLGIDALVLGSDRPYAAPVADLWGDAATRAVRVTNPRRVLGLPVAGVEGVRSWPRAS